MYAKIINDQVVDYPILNIRQRFPHLSLPEVILDADLPAGYFCVQPGSPPAFDPITQRIEQAAPQRQGNAWVQAWRVVDLSGAELAERSQARAAEVRHERNRRMTECDWTQVADAPVDKAAWAAYRQALRDVPLQASFPFSVDWPAPPA